MKAVPPMATSPVAIMKAFAAKMAEEPLTWDNADNMFKVLSWSAEKMFSEGEVLDDEGRGGRRKDGEDVDAIRLGGGDVFKSFRAICRTTHCLRSIVIMWKERTFV